MISPFSQVAYRSPGSFQFPASTGDQKHMISVFICNNLPNDMRNPIGKLSVFTFKNQSHSGPGSIDQALILILRYSPALYIFILAEFFCTTYTAVFSVI